MAQSSSYKQHAEKDNRKSQGEPGRADRKRSSPCVRICCRTYSEIERLDSAIDSLNATVDTISAAKAASDQQLTNTTNELNKVYYVFGNKAELKDHNIIEGGGFLRKTKIMESDFDQSYFTVADRRNLLQIPLYSKKAKLLTKQPESSYQIVDDANGQKVLQITRPDEFWKLSNYLVIQTD